LLADESADRESRLTLAQSYNSLANRLKGTGRPEEVEQAYRDALTLFRRLAGEFPTVAKFRLDLAICLTNLAILIDSKRPGEAELLYQEALGLTKRLTEDYPTMVQYQVQLATVQNSLGFFMRATNRIQEAEKYWNGALTVRKALAGASGTTPRDHHSLAITLKYLGELRHEQKQFRASCELLQQSIVSEEAALKAAPRNPSYLAFYGQTRLLLAQTLVKMGDHAAVADATARFLEIGLNPANDSYEAACLLGQCVALARQDVKRSQEQRSQTSESYAKRAVELLRTAFQKGFKDGARLRQDPDLDALHSRTDFQELLALVEGQGLRSHK
jgi:tetratricopeptide (TPR) repeat protein